MHDPTENTHAPTPVGDDEIARLLQIAGPRTGVDDLRTARVRRDVRLAWRTRVRARRRRRFLAGFAAAAGLVMAVGLVTIDDDSVSSPIAPVAVQDVGTIERIAGGVTIASAESTGPATPGVELTTDHVVSTEDGRVALRLATGHSLRLDTATRLAFESPTRLRLEHGAVYLDSDVATSDVTVVTAYGVVHEIGTRFEVRAAGDGLRVRVRDGAIELEAPHQTVGATAGTEVALDLDGRIDRGPITAHDGVWAWVQAIAPGVELEGATLETFLAWVTAETGLEVELADASSLEPEAVTLHGSIDGLSPLQALAAVLPTCGLRHRIDDGRLIVLSETT